jgi:hypothetical protein
MGIADWNRRGKSDFNFIGLKKCLIGEKNESRRDETKDKVVCPRDYSTRGIAS